MIIITLHFKVLFFFFLFHGAFCLLYFFSDLIKLIANDFGVTLLSWLIIATSPQHTNCCWSWMTQYLHFVRWICCGKDQIYLIALVCLEFCANYLDCHKKKENRNSSNINRKSERNSCPNLLKFFIIPFIFTRKLDELIL